MKRTLERVAFMLVGAMLVGVAYLFGSADQRADAKGVSRFEEVVITGDLTVAGTVTFSDLIVKDQVAVGDLSAYPQNVIFIQATGSIPSILLYHNVRDMITNDSDASVYILAGKNADGKPNAVISLQDKFGNDLQGISNSGWSDR
jgi:hypothetical protein